MTNSFLTENLNKNQSEVLVNVNQTQEIEFQKASEEIKKGLVSDNSFAISNKTFDDMKLDHRNIFVDGNNYILDTLMKMVSNLKPYKITHLKIEGRIFYKTIIQNDDKAILVDGPLTSGYGGQGPTEFAKLLNHLGLDEETINKYIFTKQGDACVETTFILIDNI